ncbi:MAG: hypothetical protein KGL40_05255 [Rhodocyclaceae bacterium]|nr:hypothetical protein [Rhodocyclaceae bacterium]
MRYDVGMPLRAVSPTGSLQAYEFDSTRWAQLKAEYRAQGLRMPCCDSAAIPKISSKGTKFFAHAHRGECTSAPESDEHLWCKELIATAATRAGWTVTTELRGRTPIGENWVADVHCQKGSAQVVFEVQMSQQTKHELRMRQERYQASGIRAAWFYAQRHRKLLPRHSKSLPAFSLSAFESGQVPLVADFDSPLPDFIAGLLAKRLRWDVPLVNKPVHIEVMEDTCWACRQPVKHAFGHIEGIEIGDDPGEEWHPRAFTVSFLANALKEVLEVVTNDELRSAGINTILKPGEVKGKHANWPHCGMCPHCGAPQNNFHIGEKVRKALYSAEGQPTSLVPFNRLSTGHGAWVFE